LKNLSVIEALYFFLFCAAFEFVGIQIIFLARDDKDVEVFNQHLNGLIS
jgi:hypothetical protein